MTDWSAIRSAYESGSSLRQLAIQYGVSKSAIGERKYKEQWTQRTDKRTVGTTQERQHHHIEADLKVERALSLYLQRYTYQQIAVECGYADRATAYNAIHRKMEKRVDAKIEEIREREIAILDMIHQKVWPLAIESAAPNLWAVDRLLAISIARRQLFNLDIKPDAEATNQNYTKRIILTHTEEVQFGGS